MALPTIDERIAALASANDRVSKALKLAQFYKGAIANPPTSFLRWEGDPDANVAPTAAMRQALIDSAKAIITEAQGFLATAIQGL